MANISISYNECMKCNEVYTDICKKWCKKCQINYLKENFINWTSGNEKIDNFIREKQIEINNPTDIIFEWIPYDQFIYINEVDNYYFSTIYSANLKNGLLNWDAFGKKYTRFQKKYILLKYLHNLQNIDEFLNEVCNFFMTLELSFNKTIIYLFLLNRLKHIQSSSKYTEYLKIRIQKIIF
jgi:hypothetical protein